MRKYIRFSVLSSMMMLILPEFLFAQTAQPTVSELEEVVVTARLREENPQDVPLTISAFSGIDLDRAGANAMYDIANNVAGFNFEDYPGGAYPSPRYGGYIPTYWVSSRMFHSITEVFIYLNLICTTWGLSELSAWKSSRVPKMHFMGETLLPEP